MLVVCTARQCAPPKRAARATAQRSCWSAHPRPTCREQPTHVQGPGGAGGGSEEQRREELISACAAALGRSLPPPGGGRSGCQAVPVAAAGRSLLIFNLFALEAFHLAEALRIPSLAASPCLVPYAPPAGFEPRFRRAHPQLYQRLQAADEQRQACSGEEVTVGVAHAGARSQPSKHVAAPGSSTR